MDTDKIIQDLNRRFAVLLPEFYQRRIIFWYDEDKEFEDKLDEVVLENAKVIELTGNNVFCRNPGLRHLREIKITINRRNAGFFMSNFIYFYVVRSCILSLYVI